MASDAPLAEGQAQAARDAIRQGLVPIERYIERYRDPVTGLGRMAIERAARDLELEQARAETLRRHPDTEWWGNGWGRAEG